MLDMPQKNENMNILILQYINYNYSRVLRWALCIYKITTKKFKLYYF